MGALLDNSYVKKHKNNRMVTFKHGDLTHNHTLFEVM